MPRYRGSSSVRSRTGEVASTILALQLAHPNDLFSATQVWDEIGRRLDKPPNSSTVREIWRTGKARLLEERYLSTGIVQTQRGARVGYRLRGLPARHLSGDEVVRLIEFHFQTGQGVGRLTFGGSRWRPPPGLPRWSEDAERRSVRRLLRSLRPFLQPPIPKRNLATARGLRAPSRFGVSPTRARSPSRSRRGPHRRPSR